MENFNFIRFTSVKSAINFINTKTYFDFKLFYVIVSGRLAENFFNEYVKILEKKNTVAATIVYCLNQKLHEKKPYFKDKFLNPGGITFNFEDVANYILADECGWAKIPQKYIGYQPEKKTFGNVFTSIDIREKYQIALPILIGKLINASYLEKEDIQKFQELLLSRYFKSCKQEDIYSVKPSGNKNIDIPFHIIAKYFLHLYTLEAPRFYEDLNKDLTNDKFDDYHPFIFLLYDGLNKGTFKSYKDSDLYRASKLSNKEYNNLKSLFSKTKRNKSIKAIYYSKNFLSFSKKKSVTDEHLINSKDCTTILFTIQRLKNTKFSVTNIDVESFSSFKEEEVLFLPLSCFEIIDISSEKTKNNCKYREVTLKYLEEYEKEIKKHIEDLQKNQEQIDNFFINSLKSNYGEDVLKYYNKKENLAISYCSYINASPNNKYFLNKIGYRLIKDTNEAQIHVDDEILNLMDEENKIKKFFDIFNENFEQSYSIGFCLGNFIYYWDSFYNSPTQEKAIDLASLALAVGLPIMKLLPKIKDEFIKYKLFSLGSKIINVSTLLNGLNILVAIIIEYYSIFSFYSEHKINVTMKYSLKRGIRICVGVGFSVLGSILGQLAVHGIKVILGVSLGPFSTIVLGLLMGVGIGYLGTIAGDKLSDIAFGKDEFVLKSPHLYFKYIPNKYREKDHNPSLCWNKTYLCSNVKSYVIECIVNEIEIIMLLINIPNNVYEIDECLSLNNNNTIIDDDNCSVSTQNSENEEVIKIYKKGIFIGDLVTPYQGINYNCSSINFIIYGINKEKINANDWLVSGKTKENIEIVFNLSVY